ncbi:MAG: exo-alpha-sialidase, partial [Armatimonadota bacterium]|nr:exo-alpha-sialidase [Armatimonadota bacterium]
AAVVSAPEDADLLNAGNWRTTNKLPYDQENDPPDYGAGGKSGWLEGNVVRDPAGAMWNVLRVHACTPVGHAALVRVDPETHTLSFNPTSGFVDFPGGMSKFTIRFDPCSRRYWTISNNVTNPANPAQRSVLSLHSSANLRHWQHERTLLQDLEDARNPQKQAKSGFQYVDWHFEGDDLICVVRTAYRGAHNYHDSNYIVFHRVPRFRDAAP